MGFPQERHPVPAGQTITHTQRAHWVLALGQRRRLHSLLMRQLTRTAGQSFGWASGRSQRLASAVCSACILPHWQSPLLKEPPFPLPWPQSPIYLSHFHGIQACLLAFYWAKMQTGPSQDAVLGSSSNLTLQCRGYLYAKHADMNAKVSVAELSVIP